MGSTAETAPMNSEIINKLLPRVMHGFDSATAPRDSEIINEPASMGDAWIASTADAWIGQHK